ncbi:hypothetical protein B0H13DRAFT_1855205 [Mycena leptocephala]|nr:hypothetical protein B0H13DRAFT_1855205 [Mycena leptocephala]
MAFEIPRATRQIWGAVGNVFKRNEDHASRAPLADRKISFLEVLCCLYPGLGIVVRASASRPHPQQVTADRGDSARNVDDSEVNPQDTETHIREAARHFALMQAIFLNDDDVMNTEDANFDFDKEFNFTKSERQGQLRDILAILPEDQATFLDGLHSQCSSMGYCVRTFEIPHLYDKWDGTINVNTLFRGNVVLEVYVSCIRRGYSKANAGSRKPSASNGFTRSPVQRWDREAIWLFSTDTQLVKVGDETTIDYSCRYRVYIHRIREGLHDKKAWAIGLLQYLVKHRRPRSALFLKSPALHRTTTKTTSKAGHPPLPHPRIRATSRQAHRNYHTAPSPDHQLNRQPHRAPPGVLDADHSSPASAVRDPPVPPILIPTECGPEPLS